VNVSERVALADSLRNLRFPLHPDDVLFFVHIPKTAGTSMISFLDSQFRREQIFPLHSAATDEDLVRYHPKQLEAYRLVRGHYRFGPGDRRLFQHLCQFPILLTVVRAPVARTISAYRHILRNPEAQFHRRLVDGCITLRQFVEAEEFDHQVVNRQTRMIAGVPTGVFEHEGGGPTFSDRALCFLAKERLEQFAFVGLTERLEESVSLLSFTFGWDRPASVPRLNRDPEPLGSGQVDEETLGAIRLRTQLDQELYEFSSAMFEDRLERMAKEKRFTSEQPRGEEQ
jgi:hypothetical protein